MDIKVKDHEGLVRSGASGAIINTDEEEMLKYRRRKLEVLRERDRDREFQTLKNEVKDMRALLAEIYDKVVNAPITK